MGKWSNSEKVFVCFSQFYLPPSPLILRPSPFRAFSSVHRAFSFHHHLLLCAVRQWYCAEDLASWGDELVSASRQLVFSAGDSTFCAPEGGRRIVREPFHQRQSQKRKSWRKRFISRSITALYLSEMKLKLFNLHSSAKRCREQISEPTFPYHRWIPDPIKHSCHVDAEYRFTFKFTL